MWMWVWIWSVCVGVCVGVRALACVRPSTSGLSWSVLLLCLVAGLHNMALLQTDLVQTTPPRTVQYRQIIVSQPGYQFYQ